MLIRREIDNLTPDMRDGPLFGDTPTVIDTSHAMASFSKNVVSAFVASSDQHGRLSSPR